MTHEEELAIVDAATDGPWEAEPNTSAGSVWVSVKSAPLLEPIQSLKNLFRLRSDSQPDWIPGETKDPKDARLFRQKQADARFIAHYNPARVREMLVEREESERAYKQMEASWNKVQDILESQQEELKLLRELEQLYRAENLEIGNRFDAMTVADKLDRLRAGKASHEDASS